LGELLPKRVTIPSKQYLKERKNLGEVSVFSFGLSGGVIGVFRLRAHRNKVFRVEDLLLELAVSCKGLLELALTDSLLV
jgi:hypothetical protein